uniref:YbfB/YjiJ family MFS transporter n=1 Tax=Falsiroseomonas oryzae TaxID=2766473 RepID=UPI0022EB56E7
MRTAWAGAGAILAGVGLARFAYVPLFPAMVAAGWVDGGGAGLLGAGNFAGYLAGVLAGRWIGGRLGVPRALDAGMALALVAFAACAWQGGLAWLLAWRALAGVAGGVL